MLQRGIIHGINRNYDKTLAKTYLERAKDSLLVEAREGSIKARKIVIKNYELLGLSEEEKREQEEIRDKTIEEINSINQRLQQTANRKTMLTEEIERIRRSNIELSVRTMQRVQEQPNHQTTRNAGVSIAFRGNRQPKMQQQQTPAPQRSQSEIEREARSRRIQEKVNEAVIANLDSMLNTGHYIGNNL